MHVQDFEVDAAIDLGMLRFGALKNLILRTEQWFLRRFDVVSTISLSMMKVLESKGVKACNTVLFPNWSDLGNVSKSEASGREFRLLHGISESDFLVLYSGNMGQKQGLSLVIEAAQLLSKEHNICFLLCGDGADRGALEVMVDDMSLTNVLFLPLQPLELFTKMLNAANLHLIIQRAGAADLVMPSKLTNIIGSGGYSLVTADKDTELGMLLERNQYLGTLVESENLEVFTSTLKSLASNEIAIDHKLIRLFALENFEMDSVLTEFELEFVERVNMNSSH
jgi:colanic acid biosynthesis glycosyl transferase WcaI